MARYRDHGGKPHPSASPHRKHRSRREKVDSYLTYLAYHPRKLRKESTQAEARETLELLDQIVDAGIKEVPLKVPIEDVLFPQYLPYWSFDLYPKLPAEVRSMIIVWTFPNTPCEQNENCDHTISLGRTRGDCDKRWPKLPIAHEVNQEFRYTFLEHYAVVYEQDFAAKNGMRSLATITWPLCFRPIKDSLYIPDEALFLTRSYAFLKWIKYVQAKAPRKIEKVQEVSFSIIWSQEMRLKLQRSKIGQFGLLSILLPFIGLQKVNIKLSWMSNMSHEQHNAAMVELEAAFEGFIDKHGESFVSETLDIFCT